MRAPNIYLYSSINIDKFYIKVFNFFKKKIAPYSANSDNCTKCDNSAVRDGAKLLQPYFPFAMSRYIEFIVI